MNAETPTTPLNEAPAIANAENTRRAYLTLESTMRQIGFLYYLGGLGTILAALDILFANRTDTADIGIALLLLAVSGVLLSAGWSMRELRPWGRIIGWVLLGIGLLAFPVGTLISCFILYWLVISHPYDFTRYRNVVIAIYWLVRRGPYVFSQEYRDVVAATPHIKYRTSTLVLVLLTAIFTVEVILIFGTIRFREREWAHATKSQDEFQADAADCRRRADVSQMDYGAKNRYSDGCLQARGWREK